MMGRRLRLIVEQVCVIVLVVVYLSGFISIKPPASKLTMRWQPPQWLATDESTAVVEKTVIIVIDALRSDHIATAREPHMPYLYALLQEGGAHGYVVHTASPTVTLPRIKSLVTGNIPGFIDVIVNFGAQEMKEDNLIDRWATQGRRMYFYGDDTWLKLFPTQFTKYDPVTSFFVADYTEVDNNVTRHLPSILRSNEWDVLILHYLGLDHIGHLAGPQSPLIPPKLREMDTVIKDIHMQLLNQSDDFLMLICGDHGMSDAGGHGGASLEEITTSAVFISNKLPKHVVSGITIQQVSLAGTLALLSGVDIPSSNIGAPVGGLLTALDPVPRMASHHKAAAQLLRAATLAKAPRTDPGLTIYLEAVKLHKEVMKQHFAVSNNSISQRSSFHGNVVTEDVLRVCSLYAEAQKLLAEALTDTLDNFDLPLIVASVAGILIVSMINVIESFYDWDSTYFYWKSLLTVVFSILLTWLCTCGSGLLGTTRMCDINHHAPWMLMSTFTVLLQPLVHFIAQRPTRKRKVNDNTGSGHWILQFLWWCSVGHIVSLLGSSLVEEEHQTYYFVHTSVHVALILHLIMHQRTLECSKHTHERKVYESSSQETKYEILNNENVSKTCNCDIETKAVKKKNNLLKLKFISVLIVCIVLSRLLRSWNATGDKWKHLTDISDILREGDNRLLLSTVLLGLGLVFILFHKVSGILVLFGCFGIYARHFPLCNIGTEDRAIEAQCTYLVAVLIFISSFIKIFLSKNKETKDREKHFNILINYSYVSLSLVCLVIQRPENLCLFSLILVHQNLLVKLIHELHCKGWINSATVSLCVHFIAGADFFYQGNSNSLGSVDVSAGFVGVNFYSPIIHGVLIAAHTFGGSILARITLLMQNNHLLRDNNNWDMLTVWWKVRLYTLLLYVINVAAQRHHLFIWSVFTPKLLYEGAHLLILVIITIATAIIEILAKYI